MDSSSRFNCMETADWVRCRRAAALVTPPASATMAKLRRAVTSRFLGISRSVMLIVKTIRLRNVTRLSICINDGDAAYVKHHDR